MELSETRIDAQVLIAVITYNVSECPVSATLTTVSAVASLLYMPWVVGPRGPATPCWTCPPYGCPLGRVGSR
jgi:hypothetical protein